MVMLHRGRIEHTKKRVRVVVINWPEPLAQSVGGSDCGSEGMGLDPYSGQSKVRLFSLSILTDKTSCSGGSEL
jgi:hypothetical protein